MGTSMVSCTVAGAPLELTRGTVTGSTMVVPLQHSVRFGLACVEALTDPEEPCALLKGRSGAQQHRRALPAP